MSKPANLGWEVRDARPRTAGISVMSAKSPILLYQHNCYIRHSHRRWRKQRSRLGKRSASSSYLSFGSTLPTLPAQAVFVQRRLLPVRSGSKMKLLGTLLVCLAILSSSDASVTSASGEGGCSDKTLSSGACGGQLLPDTECEFVQPPFAFITSSPSHTLPQQRDGALL